MAEKNSAMTTILTRNISINPDVVGIGVGLIVGIVASVALNVGADVGVGIGISDPIIIDGSGGMNFRTRAQTTKRLSPSHA